MNNLMQLSSSLQQGAIDYAGQGNAILGIRDSGKTYTAMKAAEQLLDAGIPFFAYDPVGVWKNLKYGIGKHKGYPVVVAGGEGSDIRLTPGNAADIVRAAMKANISLVIDLYSPELINKSTWIKIVQETVDLLMYENKAYGLRHIFLEEAAEFIPQRLQPQHSRVYASIERLARMGRNARLGMTIINQRAEEVNKAILEICAFSLLHKQVGKNSLKSIQTWLELLQLDNVQEIVKSLPTLQQGECWAIGHDGQPKKIKVSPRNTHHPDPKKGADPAVKMAAVDVSGFVSKMNQELKQPEFKKQTGANPSTDAAAKGEIANLRQQLSEAQKAVKTYKELYESVCKALRHIAGIAERNAQATQPEFIKIDTKISGSESKVSKSAPIIGASTGSLSKCAREIIRFLTTYPQRSFSKAQVAIATGYSPVSGGFNNSLSELNTAGFIIRDGRIQVNNAALPSIQDFLGPTQTREYSVEAYRENLGKCEREIFDVLLKHANLSFTKEEVAQRTETGYSPTSGGFNNALSRLSTLELVERRNGAIQLNQELLELM